MTAHRQIFRSSAIVGGASVINVIIGVAKVKVLAVLLGPVGLGLMGFYQNILGVTSTLAGCGLSTSGVRQVAAARDDAVAVALVRKVLLWANLLLGLTGMVLLWLLREPVSQWVFGNTEHVAEVGYLGVGVLFVLLAGAQMAVLQGMRRIGDVARVQVASAFAGAAVGVFCIWFWGQDGLVAFVLAAPATSMLVAAWYAHRLSSEATRFGWSELRRQGGGLFALGIPLMMAAIINLGVELAARAMVLQSQGGLAAGYFQAAWAISMIYLGFVLNSMAAEYFPRLSSVIHDREHVARLVNEQTEMVLLLAGPVLLLMMTLAPWIIELLYAKSFMPATEILRWMVLGDIVKVMTWPMGFIVLAQGRGMVFVGTQLNWNIFYLAFLWFGLPEMGLLSMGAGYFVAFIAQIIVVRGVAGWLTGFRAESRNLWLFFSILLAGGLIFTSNLISANFSYAVGAMLTLAVGVYSVRRLNRLMDLANWIGRRVAKF